MLISQNHSHSNSNHNAYCQNHSHSNSNHNVYCQNNSHSNNNHNVYQSEPQSLKQQPQCLSVKTTVTQTATTMLISQTQTATTIFIIHGIWLSHSNSNHNVYQSVAGSACCLDVVKVLFISSYCLGPGLADIAFSYHYVCMNPIIPDNTLILTDAVLSSIMHLAQDSYKKPEYFQFFFIFCA